MSSKLASGLLAAPNGSAIGDVLWTHAAIKSVKAAKSALSLDAAAQIFPTLTPKELKKFAKRMPSAEVLEAFIDQDADFATGALENDFLRISALEKLAASSLSNELVQLASDRLDRARKFQLHASNQTLGLAALTILLELGEYGAIIDALLGDSYEDVALLLASFEQKRDEDPEKAKKEAEKHLKRLAVRSEVMTVLEMENPDRFNEIMGKFLGLDSEPQAAKCVDTFIASWLCESDSFEAGIAVARLLPEGGVRKSEVAPEFTQRLTTAARERFKKHDTLWDLVASRVTSGARNAEFYGNGDQLGFAQLMSYNLALGADGVSGFVFSSTCELEPEEIAQLLSGVSMLPLSQFFMGEKERYVTKGTAAALIEPLDEDEIAELLGFFKDADLSNLPWYPELLVSIPGYFQGKLTPAQGRILNQAALEALGDDSTKWEALLEKAPSWEQSFTALLEEVR